MNTLRRGGEFIKRNKEELATLSFLGATALCVGMVADGVIDQDRVERQIVHSDNHAEITQLEADEEQADGRVMAGALAGALLIFPTLGEFSSVKTKRRLGVDQFHAQQSDYANIP